MLLFIPRSLCALKRVAAKEGHARYARPRRASASPWLSGVYRAEATDGRRAMIVQGLIPGEDPPWPGFKDLPDDACETVILPRDLERACKVGEDFLQSRFGLFGIATMGNDVCLGLGSELVTARTVEGRFPKIDQVIPRKRPLFTFSFDPEDSGRDLAGHGRTAAGDGPARADVLLRRRPAHRFLRQEHRNGILIDALVVPLTEARRQAGRKPGQTKRPASGQPSSPEQHRSQKHAQEEAQETCRSPTDTPPQPEEATDETNARQEGQKEQGR